MGPSRIATSSSSWASALHPSNTQETRAKSKKRLQSGGQWKSTFPSLKWSTKVHARGFTFSSKWAEQWPCVYYQAAVWTPSALWSFSPPPQFSSVKAPSSPQWHCQARKWGPGKKTLIPSFMHWSVKQGFACYQSWKCSKSFMHWSQIRLLAKSGDVPERNTHTYWSQYPSHLASEQHLQVSELPWPHFAIDSLVIALCTPESHGAWLLQVCHHPQKHLHNQHCW